MQGTARPTTITLPADAPVSPPCPPEGPVQLTSSNQEEGEKGKGRRREVGPSGPQMVFLSLTVGLAVPLGFCLVYRGCGPL